MSVVLASYKLRFHDEHVRAVVARDEAGCPFSGPGVDLRGEDARAVLDLVAPVKHWLEAREPGIVLRSMSVDLSTPRVLITLEAEREGNRPRVLRFDPPHAGELVSAASAIEETLGPLCAEALRRRVQRAGRT